MKNFWGIGVVNVLLLIALGVVVIAGAAVAQNKDKHQALVTAVTFHDVVKIKELIESGADVEARDEFGRTCLVIACSHGNLEIVKLLVAHGANVNNAATDGTTPLLAATTSGSMNAREIKQLLLAKGAAFSVRNKTGKTALESALLQRVGHD